MSGFRVRVLSVVLLTAVVGGLAVVPAGQAARAATPPGQDARAGRAPGSLVTALPGRLFGVSAVSPADVWAVGNDCSAGPCTTLTLHWNGTSWSKVASPSPGNGGYAILTAVYALSATSAWAVGDYCPTNDCTVEDTLILHWNGTAWARVNSPGPSSPLAQLLGVIATSPTSAWAVGDYVSMASGQYQTLILHWNGRAWSQVNSPNPSPGHSNFLTAVGGTSSTGLWAAGYYGTRSLNDDTLILHWNGTAWSQVNSPSTHSSVNQLEGVTASSQARGWAVGYYATGTAFGYKTLILRWNGTFWSLASSPDPSRAGENFLSAVTATSPANAWAVGEYCVSHCGPGEVFGTLILHWNGTRWSAVNSPSPSSTGRNFLDGVAATSATNAWAVGTYPDTSNVQHVLILHWNGTTWSRA